MFVQCIVVALDKQVSIYSKCLERDEFWLKELKTVCPCALNDNICGVGNISQDTQQVSFLNMSCRQAGSIVDLELPYIRQAKSFHSQA